MTEISCIHPIKPMMTKESGLFGSNGYHFSNKLLTSLFDSQLTEHWHYIYHQAKRLSPSPLSLKRELITLISNKISLTPPNLPCYSYYRKMPVVFMTPEEMSKKKVFHVNYQVISTPLDNPSLKETFKILYSKVGLHAAGWFTIEDLKQWAQKYRLMTLSEPKEDTKILDLPLVPIGTKFEISVWELLSSIPPGSTKAYSDLSNALKLNKGHQAIGRAVGNNPLSVLIPCHRILGRSDELRGYRWGLPRKLSLLYWESEIIRGK